MPHATICFHIGTYIQRSGAATLAGQIPLLVGMRLASASGEREDLGFCLISIGYVSKNVVLTCVYVRAVQSGHATPWWHILNLFGDLPTSGATPNHSSVLSLLN
jgi:hypothetical protein